MNYNGSVQVKDKHGWSKTFPLTKALTMIGSAGFSDIVLPEDHGSGVANAHLQLISTKSGKRGFRMVNLVNEPLMITLSGARGNVIVPAKGSRDLEDGESLQLGDFQLTFYLQSANGILIDKRSENIGVTFEMPSLELKEERKLTGLITVKNFGQERRCQFEVDLEGLPSDCYQIDPAPLLYPGGEEKLQIRFFHLGVKPPAGECPIQLHVTAVEAYPTEEVVLPFLLSVEPINRFSVEVWQDLSQHQESLTSDNTPTVPVFPILANQNQEQKAILSDSNEEGKIAIAAQEVSEHEPINNTELKPAPTTEKQVEKQEEADWWSENDSITSQTINDPLAELKRGKSKLSVPKSKVQVLKVTTENPVEDVDE